MSDTNRIAEYRRQIKKTQQELCAAIGDGWGQSRLSMYELGHNAPSLPDCRKIVAGLVVLGADCTLDDVFPPKTEATKPKTEAA